MSRANTEESLCKNKLYYSCVDIEGQVGQFIHFKAGLGKENISVLPCFVPRVERRHSVSQHESIDHGIIV